jgi:uncharacterized protein YbbK (DUF523 family)
MKLISACLLGLKCPWSGDDRYRNNRAVELAKFETLIPVCPEQMGGLPTPRLLQETRGSTGDDVLNNKCRVINKNGQDVTEEFIKGAEETLKIARQFNIKEFIAKSRSPSCGCGQIYDGTFSGKLIDGDGVTTVLLRRNGLIIIPEEDF